MAISHIIEYTDADRKADFDYYVRHMTEWYKKYGRCYVAVRNGEMIGRFETAADAVENLADQYPIGTYIVQRCDADDGAYKIRVQSFLIA